MTYEEEYQYIWRLKPLCVSTMLLIRQYSERIANDLEIDAKE